MCQGGQIQMSEFAKIPLSILAGVLLGGIAGWFLAQFLKPHMREIIMYGTV